MDFTLIIPDETLCYIFALVQIVESGAHRPYIIKRRAPPRPSAADALGWIKITFVNRRWRQAAIGDATLWTCVTGEFGWDWVNEFFRRSKNAPLDLDTQYFRPPTEETEMRIKDLVTAHHARLARLHVSAYNSPNSLTILNELLSNAFENLEEINLTANYYDNGSEPLISLLTRTPRLRHLILDLPCVSYAALNWRSTCFLTLTKVDIALDSRASSAITPPFLDALRQMTALTHLSIHESSLSLQLSCKYRCSAMSEDLIHFRNMKSVVVTSSLETNIHLLRHIRLPSGARINLGAHSLVPNPPAISPTYDALTYELDDFIHAYEFPTYSSACLSFGILDDDVLEGPGNMGIDLGLNRASLARRPKPVPSGAGKIRDPHREYGVNDLSMRLHDAKAPNALRCLPLDNVRSLTLFDAGLSRAHAQLSHFPNVERLTLHAPHPSQPHGLQLLESPALLPKLRIVNAYSDALNLYAEPTEFAEGAPGQVPACLVLENILRVRRQVGSPLQGIYLHIAEKMAQAVEGRNSTVIERIERLRAIEGVEIVAKGFDASVA